MERKIKRILVGMAVFYAVMMLYLLFFREVSFSAQPYAAQLRRRLNLVPFHTIKLFLNSLAHSTKPSAIRHAIANLFGNVLMFIPLGFFPPMLWKVFGRLWRTLLLAAGIMTVLEIMQMVLLVGTCDVDDLLLNTVGAAIGYGFFRLAAGKTEAAKNLSKRVES